MPLWPFAPDCAHKQTRALRCTWDVQTLGKQTVICIKTEASITTSALPQRPQWRKAGSKQTCHWASSTPHPHSAYCPSLKGKLCQTTRLLVTKHAFWWSHRKATSRVLTCRQTHAIKRLFLCSLCAGTARAHLLCRWAGMTTSVCHQGTGRY